MIVTDVRRKRTPKPLRPEEALRQPEDPGGDAERSKIQVEDLHAWFGPTEVLKGITLAIPEHRITAVIGPSGCGKSTLIRCMNRMHEVIRGARVQGRVLLDEQDVYDPRVNPVPLRQRVGM